MRLGLTPASLRAEPVRLEGLQQSRYWLASTYAAALQAPLLSPDMIDAKPTVARLLPVTREVTPMLLPEQRIALRAQVESMSLDTSQKRAMTDALADDIRADPLAGGLLEEHRAYTREQDERVGAALTPLELGLEGDAIRYAYPDRSFSAVYDTAPAGPATDVDGRGRRRGHHHGARPPRRCRVHPEHHLPFAPLAGVASRAGERSRQGDPGSDGGRIRTRGGGLGQPGVGG
ncbi:MAG: hypothetical protein AAF721_31510 [Myxococcota bacterium]